MIGFNQSSHSGSTWKVEELLTLHTESLARRVSDAKHRRAKRELSAGCTPGSTWKVEELLPIHRGLAAKRPSARSAAALRSSANLATPVQPGRLRILNFTSIFGFRPFPALSRTYQIAILIGSG